MAQTTASITGAVRLGAPSLVFDPIPTALSNVSLALGAAGALPATRLVASVDGVPVIYQAHARNGSMVVDGFAIGFAAGAGVLDVGDGRIATSATYVALRETTAITRIQAADDTLARLLKGNGAANTIVGGLGSDTVEAGAGNDSVEGRDGNDLLVGGMGADRLFGGAGDDRVYANIVAVDFKTDNDLAAHTLDGGSGNDILGGAGGRDSLYGGTGNDSLYGRTGDDVLYAGAGNDILAGGSGVDRLYGGDGNDLLFADTDTPSFAETSANTLDGGAGNDLLVSSSGADMLDGGLGNDTIQSGFGNDTIMAWEGNDSIDAGAGNDRVVTEYGDAAILTIRLGTGNDTLESSGGGRTIQTVFGDSGHDVLDLTALRSTAYGGSGNDVLLDRASVVSTDKLYGDNDSDLLVSSSGADILYGGSGNDWLRVDHASANVETAVRVWGGLGNDTTIIDAGSQLTTVVASLEDGNDVLWAFQEGEDVRVTAYGGAGNDAMLAVDSGDVLHGGDGNDALWDRGQGSGLYGGGGSDVFFLESDVNPGQSATRASGGEGADLFVIPGLGDRYIPVVITDFSAVSGDRILLDGPVSELAQLRITQTANGTFIRMASQSADDPSAIFLQGFTGQVTVDMFAASSVLQENTAGWNTDPSTHMPDLWAV